MIYKSYELERKKLYNNNLFLLYGENNGLIKHLDEQIINNKKIKYNLYKFECSDILKNSETIYNLIFSGTLFDSYIIILIENTSEKLLHIIEDIISKKIENTSIIFHSGKLDKKSKLRNLFEKDKRLICIACYEDTEIDLKNIIQKELLKHTIKISQESINLLVQRAKGNRLNLKNELDKLISFASKKKTATIDEVSYLTNLASNYSYDELVNLCLAGETKRFKKVLEENIFSIEDFFITLKSLSLKVHRLIKIKILSKNEKNLDQIIYKFRPPIFWKEKDILKKQIKLWKVERLNDVIYKLNKTELDCKKNNSVALNILLNLFSEICLEANNAS